MVLFFKGLPGFVTTDPAVVLSSISHTLWSVYPEITTFRTELSSVGNQPGPCFECPLPEAES
jgi:hypothetical protein